MVSLGCRVSFITIVHGMRSGGITDDVMIMWVLLPSWYIMWGGGWGSRGVITMSMGSH